MLKRTRIVIVCLLLITLTACVSNNNSSVYYDYDHGYHTVLLGETLYSIAWRQGLDYKQLARWNNIRSPYTIYAGQRLRLTATAVTSNTYAEKRKAQSTKSTTTTSKPKAKSTSTANAKPPTHKPIKHDWGWPTKGKLISAYSVKVGGNKGIDIAGKVGQPIFAAAAGKVVYSGDGLSGYGNLLIVKHSEQFLSAYAHNKKLLVKEGGSVTRGQKIAELGSTGTKSPKLHFEIRHNGKPVDPLKYLPKI